VVERLFDPQAQLQRQIQPLRLAIFRLPGGRGASRHFMVRARLAVMRPSGAWRLRRPVPSGEAIREAGEPTFGRQPSEGSSHRRRRHSTGAAVDLTWLEPSGSPLAMGGEIDASLRFQSRITTPKAARRSQQPKPPSGTIRRCLLGRGRWPVAGFQQPSLEWWAFQLWADQLWAWAFPAAKPPVYGRWLAQGLRAKGIA